MSCYKFLYLKPDAQCHVVNSRKHKSAARCILIYSGKRADSFDGFEKLFMLYNCFQSSLRP